MREVARPIDDVMPRLRERAGHQPVPLGTIPLLRQIVKGIDDPDIHTHARHKKTSLLISSFLSKQENFPETIFLFNKSHFPQRVCKQGRRDKNKFSFTELLNPELRF